MLAVMFPENASGGFELARQIRDAGEDAADVPLPSPRNAVPGADGPSRGQETSRSG